MVSGGEVQETFRCETCVAFEWCLQDFFSMPEENFFQVMSPGVTLQGTRFHLLLSPNGLFGRSNTIQICLWIYKSVQVKRFRFSLGHKKANGDEEELCREVQISLNPSLYQSIEYSSNFEFLNRSDLQSRKDELAPSDVVTFTCKIWSSGSPDFNANEHFPQAKKRKRTEDQRNHSNNEDYSTLSQNLRDLLLKGDNHDVVLKLKNKEYKAHKNILGARSPVFAAMFRHEMVEAANNSVTIEDCDPVAFSKFLLYVYSGELVNISPSIALHLNYIADKYDVPMLKVKCITFWETSLSASNVCDNLVLAEKHHNVEFFQRAITFFAENLQEILKSEKWKQFMIADTLQASKILEEAATVLSKK